MILEVVAAMALGALLLWLAFGKPAPGEDPLASGDFDPVEETPRGRALLAIKELEFDRETGKIAEDDYQDLRMRLAAEAVTVLESGRPAPAGPASPTTPFTPSPATVSCPRCGPRPEPDAIFCSRCGGPIPLAA